MALLCGQMLLLCVQLTYTHWGQFGPLRHPGIGSLPSATSTTWSARTAEVPGEEARVGIAQYNPTSATTVNRTSRTLFILGESPLCILLRAPSICLTDASCATEFVDNGRFLRILGSGSAGNCSPLRALIVGKPTASHPPNDARLGIVPRPSALRITSFLYLLLIFIKYLPRSFVYTSRWMRR